MTEPCQERNNLKKKYLFFILLIHLALVPIFGCSKKSAPEPSSASEGKKIEYTCSMHPFVHETTGALPGLRG